MKAKYLISLTAAALLVLTALPAAAQDYDNMAALFDMGAGARTMGMGGAFIGLADDENAALYNPAGLAFFEGGGINTTTSSRFDALTHNSAVGALGPFGVAGTNLSSGMFEVTDEDGIPTGGHASYSSTALVAGVGAGGEMIGLGSPMANLGVGLQVRSFHSNLYETQGSGFSLSLSSLYKAQIDEDASLQFGIIVPSLIVGEPTTSGSSLGAITYEDADGEVVHREQFPNNFGAGVGIKTAAAGGLNMALDWRAQGGIRAGLEKPFSVGAMRVGVTGDGALTAGGGINLGILGLPELLEQARIDGVFQWQSDLGSSWMLSFAAQI